jgi:hypothetical protein
METFFLVSTELREAYAPRTCRVLRRLRSELRDDIGLVEIDPPLPRSVYDTDREVRFLILATRLEGQTLFPVSKWPSYVYICLLKGKDMPDSDVIVSVDLRILDWGEIRNVSASDQDSS